VTRRSAPNTKVMRRLLKVSIIILPAALGILVSSFIAQRIFERYRARASPNRVATSGSFLPRGPMIDLHTNHDEYETVTKGKVLLTFLTTDCDACKKEVSNISQAIPSLASKVRVYGVCIEDRDSVIPFAEENHVDFPILLDHGGRILTRLGFRLMPTKVLLQNGIVTRIWYGSSPNKEALIKDVGEVEAK
jgi:peroxiredoxin